MAILSKVKYFVSVVCLKANPGTQFRGFVVQPREFTIEFSESPDENSVGEFINLPTEDVQQWSCPIAVSRPAEL